MDSIEISTTKSTTLKFRITVSGADTKPDVTLWFPYEKDVYFAVKGKVEGDYAYITIPPLKGLVSGEVPAHLAVIVGDVYNEPWRGTLIFDSKPKATATLEGVRSLFIDEEWKRCEVPENALVRIDWRVPRCDVWVRGLRAKGKRLLRSMREVVSKFPNLRDLASFKCQVVVKGGKEVKQGAWVKLCAYDLSRRAAVVYDLGRDWVEYALVRFCSQAAYWASSPSLTFGDNVAKYTQDLRFSDPLIFTLENVAVYASIHLQGQEVERGFKAWWSRMFGGLK